MSPPKSAQVPPDLSALVTAMGDCVGVSLEDRIARYEAELERLGT
jgi:hypothetical protein